MPPLTRNVLSITLLRFSLALMLLATVDCSKVQFMSGCEFRLLHPSNNSQYRLGETVGVEMSFHVASRALQSELLSTLGSASIRMTLDHGRGGSSSIPISNLLDGSSPVTLTSLGSGLHHLSVDLEGNDALPCRSNYSVVTFLVQDPKDSPRFAHLQVDRMPSVALVRQTLKPRINLSAAKRFAQPPCNLDIVVDVHSEQRKIVQHVGKPKTVQWCCTRMFLTLCMCLYGDVGADWQHFEDGDITLNLAVGLEGRHNVAFTLSCSGAVNFTARHSFMVKLTPSCSVTHRSHQVHHVRQSISVGSLCTSLHNLTK
jgi:hypothetical protein